MSYASSLHLPSHSGRPNVPLGGGGWGKPYDISDYRISYVNGWGEEEYMKWKMSTANYLMMIPFSIEKLSVGRPAMFQSLIFTGSPKVPVTEKSFEQGMLMSRQAFTHSTVCCWQEKTREIILWSRAQRTGRWWYWRRCTPALIKILCLSIKLFELPMERQVRWGTGVARV